MRKIINLATGEITKADDLPEDRAIGQETRKTTPADLEAALNKKAVLTAADIDQEKGKKKMNLELVGLAALGLAFYLSRQKTADASSFKAERVSIAEARALVVQLNNMEFGGWFKPAEVLAVIEIESSFRRNAYRAEPRLGDASLGLMQLLYSTAKDRGYVGDPAGLFDPATNIRMGMRQLKWSWDYLARRLGRDPTEDEWIGSYNAGVGNVANKGFWVAGYVQKWREATGRYV